MASSTIGKDGYCEATCEQLGAALALLPQRAAAAGVAAGEQQGAGGALAEAAGEQGRPADLLGDELLDLLGLEDDEVAVGGSASVSGIRMTMPSSEAMAWPSMS